MEVEPAMSPFKGDSQAQPAERETRSGSFSNVTVSLCHCVWSVLCHCVTVSLCYCVTVLLCHCVTVSLCHCVTVLLCH